MMRKTPAAVNTFPACGGTFLSAALPVKLTLDFSGVSFMDSSGIAVVMRALKRMRAMGGSAALRNVLPQAGKVFTAAGAFRTISYEEGERRNEN